MRVAKETAGLSGVLHGDETCDDAPDGCTASSLARVGVALGHEDVDACRAAPSSDFWPADGDLIGFNAVGIA